MFRRIFFILAVPAMVLASIMTATAAQAASPHFVGSQSCIQSGSAVTCNFSVAGLGNATTATASVQSPFQCVKTTSHEVRPGGLASSGAQTFAVQNGRINVSGLQLTARCPDAFAPEFTGPATVIVNGQTVGTIPIT